MRFGVKVYNPSINIQKNNMKTLLFLVFVAVLFSNALVSADNSFLRLSKEKAAPMKDCPAETTLCGGTLCCEQSCCFMPVIEYYYCCTL